MSDRKVTDAELAAAIRERGLNPAARMFGIAKRTAQIRRRLIERRTGEKIESAILPGDPGHLSQKPRTHVPGRLQFNVTDGVVLVGSDWHIWPGPASLMHRAMIHFCRELRPAALIANGDVVDFCQISRHPPIGWERSPTPQEEIEAAQERLHEIELAVTRSCQLAWALGNHDSRFETKLATVAPEFAKVHGIHLKDHFGERWRPCWSVWINDDVVVKHRFKGGIHAGHNNAMWSGKTVITGHLHSAKVTPFTDYNGDRYGVDTGCMANIEGPQFNYLEDNPRNWRQAFCVLTFKGGRLLPPELVTRWDDDAIVFRGDIIQLTEKGDADRGTRRDGRRRA